MGSGQSSTSSLKDTDEFDRVLRRLSLAEAATNRVKKESKKVNEALLAMNRAEVKLTDDLSNSSLCQQHEPQLRELTEEWHTFNRQLTNCTDDLNINIQLIVLEPVKRLQLAFKEVRALLKKRDHCHSEIESYSNKVAKLSTKEKTGPNLVKLEQIKQQLAAHEQEFAKYNQLIMDQLSPFIDARIDYFQPCLEGLVRAEALYWGDTIGALSNSEKLSAVQSERASSWNEYTSKQESLMMQASSATDPLLDSCLVSCSCHRYPSSKATRDREHLACAK